MFEAIAVGIMLIMKLFPETPAAKFLHHGMVERPTAWLSTRTRQHLIFGLMVVVIGFVATEFVVLAGTADLALLLAWDISLYFDAVIAVALTSSVTRLRALRHYVVSGWRGARPRRKRRARAVRTGTRRGRSANDDEAAPVVLAA